MKSKKIQFLATKLVKVAVVVPVYKSFDELTANERFSLTQMTEVLSSREIFFIHPVSVNISKYLTSFGKARVQAVVLSNKYFGKVECGNRLGLSTALYKRFSQFEYILLHHSDAFVFSDQLDYWCGQELDYVGAPWFDGDCKDEIRFIGVGNGGFSLRRVSSFLTIASNRKFVHLHTKFSIFYKALELAETRINLKWLGLRPVMKFLERYTAHEDGFWGLTVPKYYKWFKVATPRVAMKFSFEINPSILFSLNNNELPFGCHAWERYDPAFWAPFISDRLQQQHDAAGA